MKKALIIGISSGIGNALANHWLQCGFQVTGTFRNRSAITTGLQNRGAKLFQLDFLSQDSIDQFIKNYQISELTWDYLIVCPGTMLPVGPFENNDFRVWKKSLNVNLISPLEIVHGLLPYGSKIEIKPLITFIAGGGTNGAPTNFSSYIISKIALLKATEILDAELDNFRTVIFGPGWIKTKIHDEVLQYRNAAPDAFEETERRLLADDFTPMGSVISFMDWAIEQSKEVLAGRNFSSRDDPWYQADFSKKLLKDPSLLKLRRHSNSVANLEVNRK